MAKRALSIDIKHAQLLKNEDLFLITAQDGDTDRSSPGMGLFYRDCRYLSRYQLSLNGTVPLLLMSVAREGFAADIELTNAEVNTPNGKSIPVHSIGIEREQVLMDEAGAFVDVITFRNYGRERVELPVELTLAAGFESVFVLRGTPPGKRAQCGNRFVARQVFALNT